MSTSATGGYLTPTTSVVNDNALDLIFQAAVVGITGLPGDMVRPRWQATPPVQPERDVNWCAVGVIDVVADANAAFVDGDTSSQLQRHETMTVLASFYGPQSSGYRQRLRDGLAVKQNQDALKAQGIAFCYADGETIAPALVNNTWRRRHDIRLVFRRNARRSYEILSILSAPVEISSASGLTQSITVEP